MYLMIISLFIISCQKDNVISKDEIEKNDEFVNIDPSTIFTISSFENWKDEMIKISKLEGDEYLEFESRSNIQSIYGDYLRAKKVLENIQTKEEFETFKQENNNKVQFDESEPNTIVAYPLFYGEMGNLMMKILDNRRIYKVGDYVQYITNSRTISIHSEEKTITKSYLDDLSKINPLENKDKDVFIIDYKQSKDLESNIDLRFNEYKRCEVQWYNGDRPSGCLARKAIGKVSIIHRDDIFFPATRQFISLTHQDYSSLGLRRRNDTWNAHAIDHHIIGDVDGTYLYSIIYASGFGEPFTVPFDFAHNVTYNDLKWVDYTETDDRLYTFPDTPSDPPIGVVYISGSVGTDQIEYKYSQEIGWPCNSTWTDQCTIFLP